MLGLAEPERGTKSHEMRKGGSVQSLHHTASTYYLHCFLFQVFYLVDDDYQPPAERV